MINKWELWASASHFVTRHGADAPVIAAFRADQLLADGDRAGVRTYRAIIARIHRLLERPAGPCTSTRGRGGGMSERWLWLVVGLGAALMLAVLASGAWCLLAALV